MAKDTRAELSLLAAGAALFFLGVLLLLLVGESDIGVAVGVVVIGLSSIVIAYFWWAINPEHNWKEPGRFLHEMAKPVVVLLALVGAALVLQGLGILLGVDGLRSTGALFADLFGGS
ncbi:MAG: hypothetical protein OXL97_12410 [Chloroflexota bacterium]|nr:hypothetical protein [Chloroflexota bacterium]MDE2883882.1 hypothetical protein [Chloroflexota bacterium]